MKLSPHFTLEEMIFSQRAIDAGIDNTPTPDIIASLVILCAGLLEPLREKIHMPIIIDSAFRNNSTNTAVGGAHNSQHLFGEAADIRVNGMSVESLFQLIKNNNSYDQLIQEGTWVHVSFKSEGNRKQALRANRNEHGVTYANA